MKSTLELATKQIRVYPSDYDFFLSLAQERRTSIAQIIHELRMDKKQS